MSTVRVPGPGEPDPKGGAAARAGVPEAASARAAAPVGPAPNPSGPSAAADLDEAAAPAGGKSRRIVIFSVLGLILLAGIAYGVHTVSFYSHHAVTDDAEFEGHVSPVLPRVAGYVTEVDVADNQQVQAGQVLLRTDDRDLRAKAEQARGALTNAQASLAAARANAQALVPTRQRTAADVARYAPLYHSGEISQQQYDAARAAADAARAQYQAALGQIGAAQAQVVQRKADLDYAELQLSYTTMAAPAAGVVARKNVEVGQYVQAGQPLLSVVQDPQVWVVANFKETQLRKMRVGQAATVDVDAYPGVDFHGRVESISPATGARFALLPPDNATGNFTKVVQRVPVKIVLTDPPDPAHPLRVGMSVKATVNLY